jgi:23S rRNA pseudouridine955/2504/2580 synthase
MAHIGHPLCGEGKYGINREDKKLGYKWQALYSYRVGFAFEKKGSVLDYLSGREYSLSHDDIWFCADFEGAKHGK